MNTVIFSVLVLIIFIVIFFKIKKNANLIKPISTIKNENSDNQEKVEVSKPKELEFSKRLFLGLQTSRNEIWGKVTKIFSEGIDENKIEEIEEILYSADIGTAMVAELISNLKNKLKESNSNNLDLKKYLFDFLKEKMSSIQENINNDLYEFKANELNSTKVIMVVGVNGAGKTTTIGKLATKFREQGASVVVGACDTFRAAAVDQLQVWCDRSGATMVRAKEGSNPSGVGHDALQLAKNQKANYCILDTAGRLHTKENLMEELLKSKNVLKKIDPEAPHEVLLVLDAITGQNALKQALEFHKYMNVTGLIFTKCDGTSKAGSAIGIVNELKIPIVYIGVGETATDLDRFVLDDYLNGLLGIVD